MKHFLLGVLVTTAVILIGALAYLRLGLAEIRGDLGPSKLESVLMTSAVHASVRREAPEIPNPIAPTDETLIAGGKIYLNECSGCHGAPGKPDESSTTLFPPIPQLSANGTDYSEAQIFWIAKHGIRRTGMFANGKWDSDEKLWTAAAYIKRIKSLPPHVQEALARPKPGTTSQ
ncbi:MAG TPA: cytochrome c [Candidatus Acidoferrum sp.]